MASCPFTGTIVTSICALCDFATHAPRSRSMVLCRILLRCLVIAVFMHLCAVYCYAQPPTGIARSVCDYTLNDRYVVNAIEPSTVFPTGYVSCVNATGSDIALCEICSCRDNKVGSAAGVTVTGAICVGLGDATTCVGQEQEYCACNDSAGCSVGITFLRDGSEARNDDDGVVATDTVRLTNGNDTSAENNSTSSPSLLSSFPAESARNPSRPAIDNNNNNNNTSNSDVLDGNIDIPIPVIAPASVISSIDTDSGSSNTDSHSESGDSSNDGGRRSDSNTASISTSILKPASPSIGYGSKVTEPAVQNDKLANDVVGIVKPSQTDATRLKDQDIPPQENGSTLGANSASAKKSSWSGERLIIVLSTICGTGVVIAIVVFVAIRRGQSKKDTELGTPTNDYTNDDTVIVTPTNSGDHGAKYYSGGDCTVDSIEHTPLAAIAVIGFDDAVLTSPTRVSRHQYRSCSDAEKNALEDTYAQSDSHVAGKDVVVRDSRPSFAAIQQQFRVSNGPSVSVLLSPTSIPIFDTSYSRERFSSDMSSPSESPSDELFRESKVSFDSFRVTCETSCEIGHNSDSLTNISNCQASSELESEENAARWSVSSLDSMQYDLCDTEASEHMRESEMNTDSSRIALSFDMDSYGSRGSVV